MHKHRSKSKTEWVAPLNPFTGVGGAHFDARTVIDGGAPKPRIRACVRRATEMIVDELVRGSKNVSSCADEAATLGGTVDTYLLGSMCYPPETIAHVRLMDLDKGEREKWEIEEATLRLKGLSANQEKELKKRLRRRRALARDFALTLAAEATLEVDMLAALSKLQEGANLTWREHPMVHLLILELLRRLLEKQGHREVADAIGRFLAGKQKRRRGNREDFILAPALWGL